jgi:hypothetical protein
MLQQPQQRADGVTPPAAAAGNASSPPRSPKLSPTTAALLSQFQAYQMPSFPAFKPLSLNTGNHEPSPFAAFNPYASSPSNRCRSPSMSGGANFTFPSAYCPSPSASSPRLDVQKANETWDAQWSPFNAAKARASPTASRGAQAGSGKAASKFAWTYEENGHERDKGDDDSTSEEEESEDEERKEAELLPRKPGLSNPAAAAEFDPFASSSSSSSTFKAGWPPSLSMSTSSQPVVTVASKYATPAVSPRSFVSALTPRRKPTFTTPTVSVFPIPSPAVSASSFPVLHSTPNSPPPSGAATPTDPVSTTQAPPKMATAAAAMKTGPVVSPAAAAAAELLKRNTAFNKAIAATAAELFADLDTPAVARRRNGKQVLFVDERPAGGDGSRALAEVHLVPDDFTQYPIPKKRKKGKGKEKCRVM